MIEEITIFFPDGNKTSFKVGQHLQIQTEEGPKKTKIKVKAIKVGKKKCEVILSNKKTYQYIDMPFVYTSSI